MTPARGQGKDTFLLPVLDQAGEEHAVDLPFQNRNAKSAHLFDRQMLALDTLTRLYNAFAGSSTTCFDRDSEWGPVCKSTPRNHCWTPEQASFTFRNIGPSVITQKRPLVIT